MIFSKFLLALAGLCTLTNALSGDELPVSSDGIGAPVLHEFDTRADKPSPPTGRRLCAVSVVANKKYTSPYDGGDDNKKRRDVVELDEGNSTLSRRDMTSPENDSEESLDKFMVDETGDDDTRALVWEADVDGINRDVNNAAYFSFARRRKARSFGLDHLAGCTGLAIASQKGVFAGHYWENIGFNIDKNIHGDLYKNQKDAFQKSILDALKNGADGHESLSANADALSDDSIRGYLMIPATGPAKKGKGKSDPYRTKWTEMKKVIGEIIPALADENKWTEHKYAPVEDEEKEWEWLEDEEEYELVRDPMDDTARGRMLFKFDPNHHGKKKTALWMEHKLMFEDEWE